MITTKVKQILLTVAVFLVLVVAIPVGATPPEDVTITLKSQYSFLDFGNPTGTWVSEGMIASDGQLEDILKHFGAGWPPGVGFKTAHVIEVISDDNGTITISTNAKFEWPEAYDAAIFGDYCPANSDDYDEFYIGTGSWVILSGTGAYENLHGQGSATLLGCVDWDGLFMDVGGIYDGQAHIDP